MKKTIILFLVVLLAALLFFPFLGQVHLFDWDEINFAECAREMIVSGNYSIVQIDFLPFWEKPPLFIWMQALSMKLWGINEYAARFPNALCGVFTLASLFLIGSRVKSQRLGIIWVATYICSILPFLYFKSGIIDPWFNLFIFLSIYFLFEYMRSNLISQGVRWSLLSGLFLGLAILTKGPAAIIIWGLTWLVLLVIRRFRFPFHGVEIACFMAVTLLVGGFWFLLMVFQGNAGIVAEFLVYQFRLFSTPDAGHGGSVFYHPLVLLLGLFPASLFFLLSFRHPAVSEPELSLFKKTMFVLFFVVLILFSIVETKIVHYSSLCYFPLTFGAALYVDSRWKEVKPISRSISAIILCIYSLFLLATLSIPIVLSHPDWIIPYIRDPFAVGCLGAKVSWGGLDFIPAIVLGAGITIYLIRIKGKPARQFIVLGLTSLFFILSAILLYPKKVELYSQHALIEFCKSKQGEDVYVTSASFKSYAPLFYSDKQRVANPMSRFTRWLMKGDVDKPVYLVTKIQKLDRLLKSNPDLKVLYQENGYVFLIRETPTSYDK